MPSFPCQQCGAAFELSEAVLAKYPGWTPRQCRPCRDQSKAASPDAAPAAKSSAAARRGRRTQVPSSPAEVLETAKLGPTTGIFTDGSAIPNPGPGGWGLVWVAEDAVQAERQGHDPDTTNNRMELTAVWEALKLVPRGTPVTVHTDSELVVNTFNLWAATWKRNGWKRKTGAIKNLDLVQVIFAELQERPEVSLTWVPAHSGWRWNEYADALAGAWLQQRR